jgi:hypothetical protein
VTIKCKYCGHEIPFSDEETAGIKADLDRRFSPEQQAAMMPLKAICAECLPSHTARIVKDAASGALRLKRIGERRKRPAVRHVSARFRHSGPLH